MDYEKGLMSLIVLNWNRLKYTRPTLERIIETTSIPYELILVDNNSTEDSGVKQYLSSLNEKNTGAKKVKHVFNSKNLGVSGGRNSGLYVANGEMLCTIDDDVLLPDKWDVHMKKACNKIPKLGVTGVNVERCKYPVADFNGVKMQYKKVGNLGGACLCLPRRVFKRVGYYGFGRGTLYGHEDSLLRQKLDILGLLSLYIAPQGKHLDEDLDKEYRKAKNEAHTKGSIQLKELSKSVLEMRKTKNVYTPYTPEDKYSPVDEHIFTNDLYSKG